jgi:hypothetical protein
MMSSQPVTGPVSASVLVAHHSMAPDFQQLLVAGLHLTRRSSAFLVLALLLWHEGSGEVEAVNIHR